MFRNLANKFKRKENSVFPFRLKFNSEIWDQKEHFLKLKIKFEELEDREIIIKNLMEEQIYEFHLYIDYILKKATVKELSEDDLKIVSIAHNFVVQCSIPEKLSIDKLLDLLFKLYIETAMFIDNLADEQQENVAYWNDGYRYAVRIYSSFNYFVRKVNEQECTKSE